MQFAKMQGVGNDFVVVEANVSHPAALPALARRVCERSFSIGADGLLTIGPPVGDMPFSFRMFNPDGSEDMCGNGLRCACLWAHRRGLIHHNTFDVSTKDGPRHCELVAATDKHAVVRVDMGRPRFTASQIPFLDQTDSPVVDRRLKFGNGEYDVTMVNTGSTHTVIFRDQPVSDDEFLQTSPLIENDVRFPERTSVLWAWPLEARTYATRIWERGAGETLGCGTGATAVGVASQVTEKTKAGDEIVVVSRGGELTITWPEDTVWMQGPAEHVFEGTI